MSSEPRPVNCLCGVINPLTEQPYSYCPFHFAQKRPVSVPTESRPTLVTVLMTHCHQKYYSRSGCTCGWGTTLTTTEQGYREWVDHIAEAYAASSSLLPVGRQLECGQNSVLDADLVGCGKAIKEAEIFRCVDCGVPFHRECARKHFIAGESVLTAAMVDEQSRRDNSREGLRIVCSARDYLNEQIPKDWTATELLNSLWGTFMKEQSSWHKLASLPVGESTRVWAVRAAERIHLLYRDSNYFKSMPKQPLIEGWAEIMQQEFDGGVAPLMVQADLEHPRKDTGGESPSIELGLGDSREPLPSCEICGKAKLNPNMAVASGMIASGYFCGCSISIEPVPSVPESISSDVPKSSNETRNT